MSEGLLRLLRDIGKAYQALSRYDLKKAIELFKALPPQHYNTAWVLCQVGKALFEMAQYHKVCSDGIVSCAGGRGGVGLAPGFFPLFCVREVGHV